MTIANTMPAIKQTHGNITVAILSESSLSCIPLIPALIVKKQNNAITKPMAIRPKDFGGLLPARIIAGAKNPNIQENAIALASTKDM